jgi:predicted secreted protein
MRRILKAAALAALLAAAAVAAPERSSYEFAFKQYE